MSVHKYSSRGRTRQPKNLRIPDHQSVSYALASGSIEYVTASADLNDDLDSTGSLAKLNGYDTQNQDYLHLMLYTTGTTASTGVQIYAYNRCFGRWGKLRIPVSNGTSLAGMYVDAHFTGSASTTEYMVIPIHGIDRVAFVCAAANQKDLEVYAAGSTI